MPWYSIREDDVEVGRVFVLSDDDLEAQLREGQTAVLSNAPDITVIPTVTPSETS